MNADEKIKELNLELPPAPKPVAVYKPVVVVERMAYVSGHGPLKAYPNGYCRSKIVTPANVHLSSATSPSPYVHPLEVVIFETPTAPTMMPTTASRATCRSPRRVASSTR